MNKKVLISIVGLISLLGIVALTTNIPVLTVGYTLVSTVLLVSVTVGGIIAYNQQEVRDIRDIRDEERRMHKEAVRKLESKIASLEESLIVKEKELINDASSKDTSTEVRVEFVASAGR